MDVPFFSSDGFVFICQVGAVTALGAVAGIVVLRRFASRFLRLSPMQMAVALSAICIATVSAQKSGTNVVEETEGTNGVSEVDGTGTTGYAGGEVPPPLMMMLGGGNTAFPSDEPGPVVSLADAARGYRLDSVSTNEAISYEAPDDATEVGVWHLTGAYEDVQRVSFASHPSPLIPHPHPFLFPLGTNLCDSLWAYTWGKVRPQLKNASNEIVAVGSPMSALPGVSRFWTAHTVNDTVLLTWQDFVLGRLPVSSLVPHPSSLFSAQLELHRSGDFITRSNNVETVYRRINPDDWDDDGVANADDDNPTEGGEESFGPHQAYPGDLNTNHFCWVDLVVSNANALVTFVGDRPCRLADPKFVARAGTTNRVYLLIGKTYAVHCDMPLGCVGKEDEAIDVWGNGHDLEIRWPVSMEFMSPLPLLMARPLLGAAPPGGVRPQLFPSRVGGGSFSWANGFCCSSTGPDGVPCFNCGGFCGCGGCNTGDITYLYSGYDLTFGGLSCECESKGPEPPRPEDPHGSPAGPSVSADFRKRAIIFEDAYENEPGVTVPRRSTDAEVEFYVYGGTNGGTYAFSIVNGDKLRHVGGDRLCEGTVGVGQSITIRARYEAVSASGSEGDIVAKAEFTEAETHRHLADMHSELTAVKVELITVSSEPENRHRHVYGIGEEVFCSTCPEGCAVSWAANISGVLNNGLLSCPLLATPLTLSLAYKGVTYEPHVSLVEPQAIECRQAMLQDFSFPVNVAGGAGLTLELYILPDYVSFYNIAIQEIPANGSHDGYYDNIVFAEAWNHTRAHRAGEWKRIRPDNFYMSDDASWAEAMPRMTPSGTLTNDVQFGWREGHIRWPIPMGLQDRAACETDWPELKRFGGPYEQVFGIEPNGTVSVSKHGHIMSRSTNDVIAVDNEIKKGSMQ